MLYCETVTSILCHDDSDDDDDDDDDDRFIGTLPNNPFGGGCKDKKNK